MPSTTTGHVALLSTAWILPPQLCPSRGKKELARQRRSQKSIVRGVNFPAARRGMPVELIAIRPVAEMMMATLMAEFPSLSEFTT